MKHTLHIATIILAASTLFICSCNRLEQPAGVASSKVTFKASIGEFTKASDSGFSAGDAIAISAGSPINVQNVVYTFEHGVWVSGNDICWADDHSKTKFFAYYPYIADYQSDGQIDVSVSRNQDTIQADKMDFMTATSEASPEDGAVELAFQHRMALVEVIINSNVPDSAFFMGSVSMSELKANAVYSIADDQVYATGDPGDIKFYASSWNVSQGSESPAKYYAIIPAQTAIPELCIRIDDRRTYYFHLDSRFTFEGGKKYTAEITLEPGYVESFFYFDLTPWYLDEDLEFPDNKVWTYLGKGKYLDGVLAELYGTVNQEMEVDVYEDASEPGRYKFVNPYEGWLYCGATQGFAESEIIICTKNRMGYIEPSAIGVEDYAIESLVPENGWTSGYDYYLYEDYDGVFCSRNPLCLTTGSNAYMFDEEAMTTFTLPGYIRYPVRSGINDITVDPGKEISYKLEMDVTTAGLALIPSPCTITDELISSILDGSCDYLVHYTTTNKGNCEYSIEPRLDYTGAVYAIAASSCDYADSSYYWNYRYIRTAWIAEGDEVPPCKMSVFGLNAPEDNPNALEFFVTVKDVSRAKYYAIPTSELQQAAVDSLTAFVRENGSTIPGSVLNFETGGQKVTITGLEPNTEYTIFVYAENVFGLGDLSTIVGKTAGEMQFKSIGTGKFYDQLFPLYLTNGYEGLTDYLYSEVEIMQEISGKPVYRVMNPYGAFWSLFGSTEPSYSGHYSEYVEFRVNTVPDGTYISFNDFESGVCYISDFDSDGTAEPYSLIYNYYSRGYESNPSQGDGTRLNKQLYEGVFQIAPALFIGNTDYYYPYYQSSECMIICLPGYDYTFSFEQESTKASSRKAMLPKMEPIKD